MTGPQTERQSHALAQRIAALMLEKAATDVLVLDLRGLSSACDFFVICSALSEPQVKAIADHIDESTRDAGMGPWHVEGRSLRRWILLDFVHVVAHVFHREAREYYLLERLWSDAPQEKVGAALQPASTGGRRGRTTNRVADDPAEGDDE